MTQQPSDDLYSPTPLLDYSGSLHHLWITWCQPLLSQSLIDWCRGGLYNFIVYHQEMGIQKCTLFASNVLLHVEMHWGGGSCSLHPSFDIPSWSRDPNRVDLPVCFNRPPSGLSVPCRNPISPVLPQRADTLPQMLDIRCISLINLCERRNLISVATLT